MRLKPLLLSSTYISCKESDCWKTPLSFYNKLNAEFHFDFDPCPANPQFNGLLLEWGKMNFVNPPYSGDNIYRWLQKGIEESKKGKTSVWLLPVRTSTRWFHDIVLGHQLEIRWIRGRVKFVGHGNAPRYDSMLVVIQGVKIQKHKRGDLKC